MKTCLLKYRGEKAVHIISRSRAAYLFRAARSRRRSNTTRIGIHAGGCTRRIEDATAIITTLR
jgi:hypothetical protein